MVPKVSQPVKQLGLKLQPSLASPPLLVPPPRSEIVRVEPALSPRQPSCLLPRATPFNLYLISGLSAGGQRAPWLEAPALRANGREELLVTCFL